jgi:hypothetical protein
MRIREKEKKKFKRLRRISGKYLAIFGEYTENIQAYVKNTRYTKLSPNTRKIFKLIQRIHRKYILAHMKKTTKESRRILLIHQETFSAKTKKVGDLKSST